MPRCRPSGAVQRWALVACVAAGFVSFPARADDGDADGIEDGLDNCPAEKGTAANFGCKAPQLASIKPPRIEISQKVFFKQGGSIVDVGSYKLLDQVAAIIIAHPEFGTVRVEAHTDNQLDPETSLKLTQDRADNVREYLILKGIPEDRLSSFGIGLEKPVVANDTPANKSLNRRMLFIVESMEAPTPAPKRPEPPPVVEAPPPPPKVEEPPPPAITPRVTRLLPPSVAAGRVSFETRIESDAPVLVATLYWRYLGETAWEAAPLASAKAPVFSAKIEVAQEFEYYVEAFDTSGRAPLMDGSSQEPIRVAVTGRVAAPKRRPREVAPSAPAAHEPPKQPLPRSRVGLVRTAVAPVAGRGELAVSGGLVRGGDFLVSNGTLSGGGLSLEASYAFFRFLEIGAQVSGRASSLVTSAARFSGASIGDAAVRVRGVTPSLGALSIALEAGLGLPAVVDADHLAVSPSVTGAVTLALGRLNLHGMLGYRWDNSENLYAGRWSPFAAYSMGLSRFDALSVGAAVEWSRGVLVPFAEYLLELPINRRAFASCDRAECASPPSLVAVPMNAWPQRAAAGLRLELAERLAIQLAAELSLTTAGRDLGDTTQRTSPALEGLVLPAPLQFGATLLWQFGTPLTPSAAPAPSTGVTPPAAPQPPAAALVLAPVDPVPASPAPEPAPTPAAPVPETTPTPAESAPSAVPAPAPVEKSP